MVGGSTRGGDRNVTGGDRKTYERGYGFRRRGDRWLADRWNPVGGFSGGTAPSGGLNDGDPVTTWKDSSTNGNDASQTGTARPIFKTNVLNGKPVVRFDAVNSQFLNVPAISEPGTDWTIFVVMGGTPSGKELIPFANATADAQFGPILHSSGTRYCGRFGGLYTLGPWSGTAMHVYSLVASTVSLSVDGTSLTGSYAGNVTGSGPFNAIGKRVGVEFSTGDIAEIIFYSGQLALRAKLLLVLTVLVTTGQIPSTEEADALFAADDLVALEAYLIEHGVPVEQARDTLEPMGVSDRANIEKYLGTKYGIAVTSGGTAVQPDTVAGLLGWWKADSLAAGSGTGPGVPPFDPTQVTGLQAWWKADSLALSDGAPVANWTDSSTHGRNATPGVAPTFVLNLPNGKPAVHFTSGTVLRFTAIPIATPAGYTIIAVTFRAAGQVLNVMSANTGSAAPEGLDCGAGNSVYMSDAGNRVTSPIQSNRWSVYTQNSDFAGTFHVFENGMPLTLGYLGIWSSFNHYDQIGMRGDGDSGDGYIAELLFYDHILSDTDRMSVEKYLGDKYAISVAGIVGTIPGLKGWWAADNITAGSLLRGAVKKELVKTVLKGALITTIPIGPDSMAAPADGAAVSTWPDASGNGNNFLSTYGSPPTYVASGANGKPIVRFLADAFHVLDCNPFLLNQPDTIIIVAKKPNTATSGVLVDNSLSDNTHRHFLNIAPNSGFFGASAYINPVNFASYIVLEDTINHQGAFHVFVGIFNGVSSSLLVDGTLTASGDIGSASLNSLRMQCDRAGSELSEIDMAEVLIYDHALSTTDRQNLEAYLGTKYGITIAPPFNPTTIAGCKLWLKADALALSDGAAVATWPDSSGLANNAAQATAGSRPLFKTNILNGKPVMRFASATAQVMILTTPINTAAPWTVFAVTAAPSNKAIGSLASSTNYCRGPHPNTDGRVYTGAGDGTLFADSAGSHTDAAFHVYSSMSNAGSTGIMYKDGATISIGVALSGAPGNFDQVGARNPPNSDGDLAEVICYDSCLSTTDRQNVENYLKAKYGL